MELIKDDPTPANWISSNPTPWQQLVAFGPAAFEAYARLRFIPDSALADSISSVELGPDWPDEFTQYAGLCSLLAAQTAMPEDCYFCLWEGWPAAQTLRSLHGGIDPQVLIGSADQGPMRRYFLFHGALSELGEWGVTRNPGEYLPPPAFTWPRDQSWCIASDVDPHWAGIGASAHCIDTLTKQSDLDIVAATP